ELRRDLLHFRPARERHATPQAFERRPHARGRRFELAAELLDRLERALLRRDDVLLQHGELLPRAAQDLLADDHGFDLRMTRCATDSLTTRRGVSNTTTAAR